MKKTALIGLMTLSIVGVAQAQTTVWNDSFTDGTLNSNLTAENPAASSLTESSANGGQLTMNAGGDNGGDRSVVKTKVGQNGETTFNGAELYNFYDHTVTASFDIASLSPTSTASGRSSFYFAIGYDVQTGVNERFDAVGMNDGVNFAIELVNGGTDPDYWRLYYTERDGGSTGNTGVAAILDAAPTGITFELDGNTATVGLTGAVTTAIGNQGTGVVGQDTLTITMANLSIPDYTLAFGAYNRNDLDTGVSSVAVLNSFEVTVIPEPGAFALLGGCFALAWVMVRRRRS